MTTSPVHRNYCWRHMSETCKQRFYCPRCGQVNCARKKFGTQHWAVPHHDRHDDAGNVVNCPGGIVDLEKDRAP